ncbi:MAG: XdhC family protein, partial [bacterium]
MSLWGKIAELEREGKGCVVVTVVATEGSAPQALGAKMIVTADGKQFGTVGGGVVEFKAKMVALDIMQTLEPRIMTFELSSEAEEPIGMICGGKMTLFFEPIRTPETVVIFGAGHIGSRLCHLAKFAGFRVIVVDDRDEFANPKNLPDADQIIKMPFTDAIE